MTGVVSAFSRVRALVEKRSSRNFIVYVLHHGARYLFPLAVTPFLARTLGPTEFADFVIWNSCVWTTSLLMEFGFYIYAINKTAVAKDNQAIHDAVSTIVTAKALLMPAAILAYLFLTFSLGLASRQPLATAFGLIAMMAYGGSFAWYFQGLQRGITAVFVEAFPMVLQFILVFSFVRKPQDFALATMFQTISATLTILGAVALLRKERVRVRVQIANARLAIREAWPYFVERFCYTAYSTATPLIVASLSNHQQAAYYGIGDKVNAFLIGLSGPLSQAAVPVVARRLLPGLEDWSLSLKLVAGITTVTVALAAILFFIIGTFIVWLFGKSYEPAVTVARCFCVVSVFMTYQLALSNFVVIPGGRSRILVRSATSALIISLLAQIALVPRLGAAGSALGRIVAEVSIAAILSYVSFQLVRGKTRANVLLP